MRESRLKPSGSHFTGSPGHPPLPRQGPLPALVLPCRHPQGDESAPGHERAQTGRTGARTDGAQARDARAAGKSWGEARAAPCPARSAPHPLTWRRCLRARVRVRRTHPPGGPRVRARGRMASPGARRARPGQARTLRWRCPRECRGACESRGSSPPGLARRQPPPPPPPAVKSAAGTKAGGEQSARSLAKLHLTRISPPSPARPAAPGACTQAAQPNPGRSAAPLARLQREQL